MKAITLWQPWASLIAVEAKKIETRSWATRYRAHVRTLREALDHSKRFIKHHEDTTDLEVCYDWCPLCRVEAALKETEES